MSLVLRYMELDDIPQVVAIDKLAFDPPWSVRSYSYEINESNYSHMVVLEEQGEEHPASGLKRLVQSLSGHAGAERRIIAYGGLWHIVDEAHISTIATHPDLRGQGYGEIVLAGMVRRSLTLGAAYIVLEVRVSNIAAQNLYKKYDFEIIDLKPRYYHNNGEDAYDMRLSLRDEAAHPKIHRRFTDLVARRHVVDRYTDMLAPRGQT